MSETTSQELPRKVLVYSGPTLDWETIQERIPDAILRPPARQSDLISDIMELEATHVLLIDGEFAQSLSPWHKEIVYALQIPGVRGVFGAASMGALRAADLSAFGMVGCGRISHWYDEGLLTDESEVSVVYYVRPDGSYVTTTVPLVNVRAALLAAIESEAIEPEHARRIFEYAKSIHWTERTKEKLAPLGQSFSSWLEEHDQKKIDAFELVCSWDKLPAPTNLIRPTSESLSECFSAQYERDRLVNINGTRMALQHLDAYVMLHDVDYAQKLFDANNRTCALLLADIYSVTVSQDEFDTEWGRFCARLNLLTVEAHQEWLKRNNINLKEFVRLMLEEARIRKVHHALAARYFYRRNTQRLFDYLRCSDSYHYWASEAAAHEERIKRHGEEALTIDISSNPHQKMLEHLARTGLTVTGSLETYVEEAGFGSISELTVAIERDLLGSTEHG